MTGGVEHASGLRIALMVKCVIVGVTLCFTVLASSALAEGLPFPQYALEAKALSDSNKMIEFYKKNLGNDRASEIARADARDALKHTPEQMYRRYVKWYTASRDYAARKWAILTDYNQSMCLDIAGSSQSYSLLEQCINTIINDNHTEPPPDWSSVE